MCVRTCVGAWVRGCVRVRSCACVCAFIRSCVRSLVRVCLLACVRACVRASVHAGDMQNNGKNEHDRSAQSAIIKIKHLFVHASKMVVAVVVL